MIRVAITGGIGSGKSTVARAFAALGAPVYDTDSRAKMLMNTDPVIREQVTALFGEQSYVNGALNRAHIAAAAFADHALLARLDAIVHPRVAVDFERWVAEQTTPYIIIESAILFESGFERLVDVVVAVSAPEEQRAARAAARDEVSPERVRQRMAAQLSDAARAARADHEIVNGDDDPILPPILQLHEEWLMVNG